MKEVSMSLQSHRLSSHGVCQRHSSVERLGVTIRCHSGHLETSGSGSLECSVVAHKQHMLTWALDPHSCVSGVGKGLGATSQQYGVPGESLPCIFTHHLHKGGL